MITSLQLKYNVDDSNIGYIIGDHKDIHPGDQVPVYIPKLMSNIERPSKTESNCIAIQSANYMCCNSSDCMPVIKTRLFLQNYILVKAMDTKETFNLSDGERVTIFYANDSLRDIYFDTDITEREIPKKYEKEDIVL